MPTTFSSLCADDISAYRQALGHVLGVADHVHVQDSMLVKTLHDRFGWNTNSTDEQFRAGINNAVSA
jgi:hypothetical protein